MHLNDEILRTYLDGELNGGRLTDTVQHLSGCTSCQERLMQVRARTEAIHSHLATLDPLTAETPRSTRSVIRILDQKEHNLMSKRLIWRPAWTILAIVAILAVTLSFQPARALASSFLNLFRVQQVTLLPMDMSALRGSSGEPTLGRAIAQIFSDSITVTRQHEDPQVVSTTDEAAGKAGFPVRTWVSATSQPSFEVDSGMAFEFIVDRKKIGQVISEAGIQGPDLPQDLDGVKVDVDIPASVVVSYGNCQFFGNYDQNDPDDRALMAKSGCVQIVQMPSPTVRTEPEIDASQIAVIGLQFMGMSKEEANEYSQTVDWASTLVIPVPRDEVGSEDVSVDGVTGKLLYPVNSDGEIKQSDSYILIWVKDGLLYSVYGALDRDSLLNVANNLQ